MSATLTLTEVAARHHRYVLDCEHATTTVDHLMPSTDCVSLDEILDVLRRKHRQSCVCAVVVQLRLEEVA